MTDGRRGDAHRASSAGAVATGATAAGGPVDADGRVTEPWLVALDIDGTIMQESGVISDAVCDEVRRLHAAGHQVMIATGRSVSMTLPVMERLDLVSDYVVCANGAMTLQRDEGAPTGYSLAHVEEFDARPVLSRVSEHLADGGFAVEDREGVLRYNGAFPAAAAAVNGQQVSFDELFAHPATRVVVISPGHDIDDFLDVVERMGLSKVNYNVGWTAWLDIAPDGVTKATALERVRGWLDLPRSRVFAAGDGRNDIDMLRWASVEGRGVAMGQAPDDVVAVANERTGTDLDDGLATALASL